MNMLSANEFDQQLDQAVQAVDQFHGFDQAIQEIIATEIFAISAMNPTPTEEAAMINDLSDIFSELTLLSAPETVILRLSAVIGKILELTSDYLPNQTIRPEELLINLPIFTVALFLFARSAFPLFKAQFTELNELDLSAHELCFAPVGVSLLQFKCMKATGCLEWITCEAGTVLIDEREYDSSPLEEDENGEDGNLMGMSYVHFEEMYMDLLNVPMGNILTILKHKGCWGIHDSWTTLKKKIHTDYQKLQPIATITIGEKGARLLRIDSRKLFDLMDHDERLESSIRLLLLKSLKLKIGNLLLAQQEQQHQVQLDRQLSWGDVTAVEPVVEQEVEQRRTKPPL
ncbi:hypothetical protein ACHAXR_002926 [Thalassiosira sp. AJA248-18]